MLEWVAISLPRNDFIHSLKAGLLVRVTVPVSCSGVLLAETVFLCEHKMKFYVALLVVNLFTWD